MPSLIIPIVVPTCSRRLLLLHYLRTVWALLVNKRPLPLKVKLWNQVASKCREIWHVNVLHKYYPATKFYFCSKSMTPWNKDFLKLVFDFIQLHFDKISEASFNSVVYLKIIATLLQTYALWESICLESQPFERFKSASGRVCVLSKSMMTLKWTFKNTELNPF